MTPFVVTIDGPAAAGKSTTAREVARRLGCLYLDSGALYRALAVHVLRRGISPEDLLAVRRLVGETELEIFASESGARVLVDGGDVTAELRAPAVADAASRLAEQPAVRERMAEIQRRVAASRSVVVEGRDTGSVVFPDAAVKIYLDASPAERAERRWRELRERGVAADLPGVREDVERRDRRDRERRIAPLTVLADSVVVDTTGLSPDEQVEKVLSAVRERLP